MIDKALLEEYNAEYFENHKRAKKAPIEHPYHPSLNVWATMPRVQANALKQKWKDFGVWWLTKLGLNNLHLEKVRITSVTYLPTRRRADADNYVPKMLLDSFVAAGLIDDDDYNHIESLTMAVSYDKENPRTEIEIIEVKGE